MQGAFGAEAEASVGFPLQSRQVIEQRRGLRGRLAFLGDRAGLAFALGLDFFRLGEVPEAFGFGVFVGRLFEILVEPFAGVDAGGHAEFAVQFEVSAGLETADFFLALHQDGEGRGLHASDRGDLEAAEQFLVERGHGARAIDADQPVALGAAGGRLAQGDHVGVAAQLGEAGPDGIGRHRLQPEALDRLLVFEVLDDVAENEFALAAGVAGIDHFRHIGAGEEFFQDAQLLLGFFARNKVEVVGQDRQVFQ